MSDIGDKNMHGLNIKVKLSSSIQYTKCEFDMKGRKGTKQK